MKSIRRFKNTLKEGIKSIWKHKNLGFVSVTSTFFTLFIIGIIIIITVTVNSIAVQIQDKVNDVEIFLKGDITSIETEKIEEEIDKLDYEKTMEYRSSQDALELMKKSWGENAELLDNIESEGLLPSSFVVKLEDISQVESFVKEVEENEVIKPYLDEIKYYNELVDQVYRVSNYVRIFGTILVVVLMVVTFFVISNTIKLTVISRTNEIAVMRYVGATNRYIRVPFIIEAIFFSLLGAVISYLLLYSLYDYLFSNFGARISENFAFINLIQPQLIRFSLLQIFLSLGFGIGLLGAIFSIRKYLSNKEVAYVK